MSTDDRFLERVKDNWRQRAREKASFRDNLRLIPRWLVWLVIALYLVALAAVAGVTLTNQAALPGPLAGAPVALAMLGMFGIVTAAAAFAGSFILLLGYINRDAKRRGMSPTLWTVVALFVPYLIGVLIYFVVREPLPYPCPQCGMMVTSRFNYCPSCQCTLRPNCPQCRREVRPEDRFCPHCGAALPAIPPVPVPPR
jgi:Double zinc ribbon